MKIIHRIAFNTEQRIIKYLESIGLKVDSNDISTVFYIEENHEKFHEVQEKMRNYKHSSFIVSKFTKKEKDSATYLLPKVTWINGYPMPDDTLIGYREETYDISSFCSLCATGLKQKSPFLLKGEPKWGKKDFLRLFWVEDEIFMKKSSYETVLKPLGISAIPVLHYKTRKVLDTIVQLEINNEVSIDLDDHPYQRCQQCQEVKYKIIEHGFFPKIINNPQKSLIMRTNEYFGHDGLAFNYILVQKEVYQAIIQHKLKGIDFIPTAN